MVYSCLQTVTCRLPSHCVLQAASSKHPSALQRSDLLVSLLQLLLLLLDDVHHERTAEENGWLVDVVMFVTDKDSLAGVHPQHTQLTEHLNSPQRPYTARLEQEGRPLLQRVAHPPLRKGAQDVAVGDYQDVGGLLDRLLLRLGEGRGLPSVADVLDQSVDPLRHLLWGSIRCVLAIVNPSDKDALHISRTR